MYDMVTNMVTNKHADCFSNYFLLFKLLVDRMHSKIYESRNIKTTNNQKRKEYY